MLSCLDTALLSQIFVLVATPLHAPHSKPLWSTEPPTTNTRGLAPLDMMDAVLTPHWQTLPALTQTTPLQLTTLWSKSLSTTTFHTDRTAYRIWLINVSFATVWLERRSMPQQNAPFSRNLVLSSKSGWLWTTASNLLHKLSLRVHQLPHLLLSPPLPRFPTLGGGSIKIPGACMAGTEAETIDLEDIKLQGQI